ncbi:MAG: hypothetical protein HDT39_08825 [Lachnospiraceae bacterium]|nr:hypothetical protein [Lachnospiraceae bacterium]
MNYQQSYNYIFNEIGDEGLELLDLIADNKTDEGIMLIKNLTSCNDEDAKQLWEDLKDKYGTSETNPFILSNDVLEKNAVRNTLSPKCPTCSSTNLKKISVTSKAVNTAMFGIFGTKRHKTFHCNNCGYEW